MRNHGIGGTRGGRLATLLTLLVAGATLSACIDDAEPILEPQADPPALMARYVSMGNSITAGFQSGGLTADFQAEAYPVLLAARAGADFTIPTIADPGCPVPLAAPLSTETVDTIPGGCAGRELPVVSPINNVAVPGAAVADLTNPLYTGGGLATLILGGRSQTAKMAEADPTLVSVWIGNNDALGAALRGDPSFLTSLPDFQTSYDGITAAINTTDAQDAVLIGVVDAAAAAPALQPGAYFWAVDQSGADAALGIDLQVSSNCAPFTLTGQPNPGGLFRLVSFLTVTAQLSANPTAPVIIDCAADAPFVLNETERVQVGTRIAEFNAYIEATASANGWIYVDPAAVLGPALQDPDLIRKCQGFLTATDAASFQAAVQNTCPSPTAPNFFGAFISFDGVHPSGAAHVAVADTLAGRLSDKHGISFSSP